jgi:hypothetical protein
MTVRTVRKGEKDPYSSSDMSCSHYRFVGKIADVRALRGDVQACDIEDCLTHFEIESKANRCD